MLKIYTILKLILCNSIIFHPQDLYESVDYGILSPQTKIKVKVNPSGVVILRADVQPERFSRAPQPFNPINYYTG